MLLLTSHPVCEGLHAEVDRRDHLQRTDTHHLRAVGLRRWRHVQCWQVFHVTQSHSLLSVSVSVSVLAQDGIVALGKAHTRSAPSLSSLLKVALETVPIFVEHRSFLTLEGGMSAASFLHSSFLQAINAVMLWPTHVQKLPQASQQRRTVALLPPPPRWPSG